MSMKRLIAGLVFLLSLGIAQAQLVPKGMTLSGDASENAGALAESSSDSLVGDDVAKKDSVAESLNWNAGPEDFADSVAIYQKDYAYNAGKRDQFLRYSNISTLSGAGLILAGVGLLAVGLTGPDGGYDNAWAYGGTALVAAGAVGVGFSFVFGGASDTYSVRAEFFKQKKIDYQKRHSILSSDGY